MMALYIVYLFLISIIDNPFVSFVSIVTVKGERSASIENIDLHDNEIIKSISVPYDYKLVSGNNLLN